MNWGHSAAGPTLARSLSSSPAAAARPHSCCHAVQFYYDDRFLINSLSDFVLGALEAGRCAVVVATREHRFDCAESLREKGVNLTEAIEQGRYVALDASDTLERFMVDGSPDAKLFAEILSDIISTSSACVIPGSNDGKEKVAIFGEMVALLLERGQIRAALRLEQLWNELSQNHSFELLCAYRISSFDRTTHRELFHQICAEHDFVIPAEGYPERGDEKDRLRTIALLQQAEQVLKTQSVEHQLAEAQSREAEYQKQQLLKEIRKHEAVEEELRKFTRRLLTARDEEQRRIAASLHENMAQLVAALSVYFGVLHQEEGTLNPRLQSAVASSRSVSDNLLNEIRKLSRLLHPPTLDDMGVGVALKEYVDHLNRHGASIALELAPNIGRFNRELEITVYRIVEEALHNIRPRSASANTTVRVMRSPSSLLLEIEGPHADNNNAKGSQRPETRFTGIHERVMEHHGSVHFTSTPSGTLISVTLPLEMRQHSSVTVSPLMHKLAS
jgi:signal transduction histidine kinase